MKRMTHILLVLVLCGLTGSALSSCKKKGTKTASEELAQNAIAARQRVNEVIKDNIRREKLLFLFDEMDRVREDLLSQFLDIQRNVHSNPDMPREEYSALVREFAAARGNSMRKIAAARITLRTYVTKKEWQTLFAQQKKKKEDPTGLDRYRTKPKESEVSP